MSLVAINGTRGRKWHQVHVVAPGKSAIEGMPSKTEQGKMSFTFSTRNSRGSGRLQICAKITKVFMGFKELWVGPSPFALPLLTD